MPEVYISVDVETDGPVPGLNSMLQLGACVAGHNHGRKFVRRDPAETEFSAWLKPLIDAESEPGTERWLREHGIDRDKLFETGQDPTSAMLQFRSWLNAVRLGSRPVFVAYPLSFDWPFSHYYFMRFLQDDPFGFSSAIDIKTMYAVKAGATIEQTSKGKMPRALTKTRFRHTHDALDDARGQADLFANLMAWDARD